jgi:hypothetical protein
MVATSSFMMKSLNEGHIEDAGELSRVPWRCCAARAFRITASI